MAKYIVKTSGIFPGYEKGDEIEFKEELHPGIAQHLVGATAAAEVDKERIANPSRDELKARATELEIEFPGNISNAKLMELIAEKEAEIAGADNED